MILHPSRNNPYREAIGQLDLSLDTNYPIPISLFKSFMELLAVLEDAAPQPIYHSDPIEEVISRIQLDRAVDANRDLDHTRPIHLQVAIKMLRELASSHKRDVSFDPSVVV